jgi:hypothetical protein
MLPNQRHIKKQATLHECLPSLLADGDIELKMCMVMGKKTFCTGPTRAAKAGQKSLDRHEPTKEGPLSVVLFEFPFVSVSTVDKDNLLLTS